MIQNSRLKFDHESKTFDNCFKWIIENKNKDDIAEQLMDYLKEFYLNKRDFFTTLVCYIIKYIHISVTDYRYQEFALFLIDHLNNLGSSNEEIEFFKLVKDALIKSILKVEAFQVLVKKLLDRHDFLKRFLMLPTGENILHFAANHCDPEKILALFEHFNVNSDLLNEPNNEQRTPLDILIQKKAQKTSVSASVNFLTTYIKTFRDCDMTSLDEQMKIVIEDKKSDLLNKLIASSHIPNTEETPHATHEENTYCFTSKTLRRLIDEQTKNSADLKISFDSFKHICERSDSLRDRNYLIEFFIAKIKKSNEEASIDESALHFLLTKKKSDNAGFYD